ncbi:MAG: dienelactone hydrolase family protein [Dehalococcoidales bacterium]|nr:dienelactone hydrolase family protein [Dehalococcoidales bacterium]
MSNDLSGFKRIELSFMNETRVVFRKGEGPAVIVMHEVPGLYPGVIRFANALCDAGFTVWLPSLLGEPGKDVNPYYIASSMVRACVMREFTVFATSKNSAVTSWLRLLAKHANNECGGAGVGAIGMCLTGGFALAMMVDGVVLAPVVCNPSLPFALSPTRKRDLGIDNETLAQAKARSVADNICVLGLRFTADIAVPKQRFQRLRDEFGDNFIALEINSASGNPHGISRFAHSVLGLNYNAEPDHPTVEAELQTINFLKERLISRMKSARIDPPLRKIDANKKMSSTTSERRKLSS